MIPVVPKNSGASAFALSAKRLTDRTVRLRDAVLGNATLAPLFDAAARTIRLVLLSPRTGEGWVQDWRPGLVKVPLLRKTRVDLPRAAEHGAAGGQPLYLYDASGLVTLAIASLCPGLVVRNAADVLPSDVLSVAWRRDLSRIGEAWVSNKGGGWQLRGWDAKWLPPLNDPTGLISPVTQSSPAGSPSPLSKPASRCGWVLDPVWAR